jgi:hypothetical protein
MNMANTSFPNIQSVNQIAFTPLDQVLTTGRVLIVGQSKNITTTKEFYANIQLWDKATIENTFGKGQEITMKLLDALTITNQSPINAYKPIIDAICYKDDEATWGDATFWIDVTGTSSISGSVKIVFNKNNINRLNAEIATRFAMMKHENAAVNGISLEGNTLLGSPKNISKPFNQKYNTSYENDSFIIVDIAKNATNLTVASAINSAINNNSNIPFTSTVSNGRVILTPKNKGAAVNSYNIQEVTNTTNKSITLAFSLNTPVNVDNVPDLTNFFTTPVNGDGVTIDNIKYDFFSFPTEYLKKSANFTVIANALQVKYNSPLNNNISDGHVIFFDSLNTSDDTEINSLATKFPIDENLNSNRNSNFSVVALKKNGLSNQAVISSLDISKLAAKKFSYCSLANDVLQQAPIYTLKISGDFQDLLVNKLVNRYQRLFTSIALLRGELLEKNYTDNKDIIDPNNYVNKATIILLFQQINKALTIGDINDELYSDKFAGIIDTNEQVNDLFNQILDNGIKFDVGSKTLSVDTYNKYPNALEGILINNKYTNQ